MLSGAWTRARLGDVCDLNPRRPELPRPDTEATSFVPMAAVAESGRGILRIEERPYAEVRRGYTFFAEGDILFAKITPCMQNGKHAIARGLRGGSGFASTEFHVLRPKPEAVVAEWVHYFLLQPDVLLGAEASFSGAVGQQRVSPTYLADLLIPVPPLEEQRRIAARLTEQLAAVERARKAAMERAEAAGSLLSAYLQAEFEGRARHGWPLRKIAEFAETGSGLTPSRSRPDYFGGSIPWVKTAELRDGLVWAAEERISATAVQETGIGVLPERTVLVAMYGQGQTRGRTGILGTAAATNQACFAVRPNDEVFEPRYLQYWFRSRYDFLRAATEGRGGNQPNLNGEILRDLAVPLPPVPVQREVVSRLDELERVAGTGIAAAAAELAAIEVLPAALLRQAFSQSS